MFRFTIRDVLWLTLVVAVVLGMGLGWWRDRLNVIRGTLPLLDLVERQDRIIQDLKKAAKQVAPPSAPSSQAASPDENQAALFKLLAGPLNPASLTEGYGVRLAIAVLLSGGRAEWVVIALAARFGGRVK